MSYKSMLITAMAAVTLFGVTVSGCNRDTRTAMKTTRANSRSGTTRPAEVLSASAYRPPARTVVAAPAPVPAPTLAQAPQQPARQYHRAPTAAPARQQYARTAPQQNMTQAEYFASAQAYAYSAPAPVPAARPVQYTPDLVVARADLPAPRTTAYAPSAAPVPMPAVYVRAPIPELEPVRYQRLSPASSGGRSAAEIMIAEREQRAAQSELQSALSPLPASPQADWVASPATAMRGGW